jgi:hypothetical protein
LHTEGSNVRCGDASEHACGSDYRLRALSYEAKLPDIPIPVACEPIPEFFVERGETRDIVLGYMTGMTSERLLDFFRTGFVQLGWKIVAESCCIESLLILEKPDRICTVNIRSLDGPSLFILTICQKN